MVSSHSRPQLANEIGGLWKKNVTSDVRVSLGDSKKIGDVLKTGDFVKQDCQLERYIVVSVLCSMVLRMEDMCIATL